MEGAPIESALDRIEAALTRIENATSQVTAPDTELAERHERLRTAVALSLRELDGLLAGQAT